MPNRMPLQRDRLQPLTNSKSCSAEVPQHQPLPLASPSVKQYLSAPLLQGNHPLPRLHPSSPIHPLRPFLLLNPSRCGIPRPWVARGGSAFQSPATSPPPQFGAPLNPAVGAGMFNSGRSTPITPGQFGGAANAAGGSAFAPMSPARTPAPSTPTAPAAPAKKDPFADLEGLF